MASRVISAILTLRDRDFSSGLRRGSGGLTDFQRRIMSAGNSVQRFSSNTVSSFSNMAKGVGGLVAAYAGFEAMKGVATSSIEAASSLEGYRNTLNVVMKDQSKAAEVMKWAVDFANKTPFETDSVVEATVRLQSYGLEAQKVLPMVGDMAGVMGKDVMQGVEAVADAQTGELERLKEFGITKAMIAQKAGEMYQNQEIINNQGQIVQQEKFNEALFALMQDRFKGGMEIQAGSFKGVMSTITGVWKTGLATMAGITATGEIVKGSLFDTIKDKAKSLGDYMTKLADDGTFQSIGNKLSSGVQVASNWFGILTDSVIALYNEAKPTLGWIKDTGLPAMGTGISFVAGEAKGLYNFVKNNWNVFEPIILGIVGAMATYKVSVLAVTAAQNLWKGATTTLTIAQGLLNGTLALTPLGWIVIGIGAVIAAGVALYNNWDIVREKTSQLWDKLGAFQGVATIVLGPIGQIIRTAVTLAENWDSTKGVWENVWNGIKLAASNAVNEVIVSINKMIETINKIPGVNIPIVPKVDWGQAKAKPSQGVADVADFMALENASFAVGTNRVPHDMVAQIHKDEMIIPAAQSNILRGAGIGIENITRNVGQESSLVNDSFKQVPNDDTNNNYKPQPSYEVQQVRAGANNTFNITINAADKSVNEIINELVPQLKLRLSNM